MSSDHSHVIDEANSKFWNELCGTQAAKALGITDRSAASLRKFDDWFFGYYPYLKELTGVTDVAGETVLEVGLGYGSLGQKLAEHCGYYNGLDIAQSPVDMMNTRLRMAGVPGAARQGNMLECPFPDESMDRVVSIGCFHHTGNAQRCIDETWRVLKPGGKAHIMVYNRYSLRQWRQWPLATLAALSGRRETALDAQRLAYDKNDANEAAPETDFFSVGQLRRMFRQFSTFSAVKRNCDIMVLITYAKYIAGRPILPRIEISRERLLPIVGPVAGIDIYVTAQK